MGEGSCPIQAVTTISVNHFGFRPAHFAIEPIFILWQMAEKHRVAKWHHLGFVNTHKAYDLTPKPKLYISYIRVVQDMYHGAKTSLKTSWGTTNSFIVRLGVHQGSAHSPYRIIMMNDLWTGVEVWAPMNIVCRWHRSNGGAPCRSRNSTGRSSTDSRAQWSSH